MAGKHAWLMPCIKVSQDAWALLGLMQVPHCLCLKILCDRISLLGRNELILWSHYQWLEVMCETVLGWLVQTVIVALMKWLVITALPILVYWTQSDRSVINVLLNRGSFSEHFTDDISGEIKRKIFDFWYLAISNFKTLYLYSDVITKISFVCPWSPHMGYMFVVL